MTLAWDMLAAMHGFQPGVAWGNNAVKILDRVIEQIETATGLKVVDHQDLAVIKPVMFSDTTHLARYYGDIEYTKYVLNQCLDDL